MTCAAFVNAPAGSPFSSGFALDVGVDALAVVIVDGEAEAAGPHGQRLADAAHADDAQPLALQAATQHRGRAPAGPLAAAHQPLAGAHAARGGQHQRHRHVGGVLGQHARGIGDRDAAGFREIQVDVIDAGAERSDELQPGTGLAQHAAVDAIGDGRHQNVGGLYRLHELGGRERRVIDVETGIEQLHEPGFDRLGEFPGDDHQRLLLGAGRHICPISNSVADLSSEGPSLVPRQKNAIFQRLVERSEYFRYYPRPCEYGCPSLSGRSL